MIIYSCCLQELRSFVDTISSKDTLHDTNSTNSNSTANAEDYGWYAENNKYMASKVEDIVLMSVWERGVKRGIKVRWGSIISQKLKRFY